MWINEIFFYKKTSFKKSVSIIYHNGFFSLDYWVFGSFLTEVQISTRVGMTLYVILVSVLYGGVIEEIMLRLFMMSLLSWLINKIFYRKEHKIASSVFVIANVLSALLFAFGHLPATIAIFGELTFLILLRCFYLTELLVYCLDTFINVMESNM